jgi:hypothetical protein
MCAVPQGRLSCYKLQNSSTAQVTSIFLAISIYPFLFFGINIIVCHAVRSQTCPLAVIFDDINMVGPSVVLFSMNSCKVVLRGVVKNIM